MPAAASSQRALMTRPMGLCASSDAREGGSEAERTGVLRAPPDHTHSRRAETKSGRFLSKKLCHLLVHRLLDQIPNSLECARARACQHVCASSGAPGGRVGVLPVLAVVWSEALQDEHLAQKIGGWRGLGSKVALAIKEKRESDEEETTVRAQE
eukprot:6195050-Pleurochrysis_carterae.AAC.1